MRVFEVMSEGVQTIAPGTRVAEARARMRTAGIHHLVVAEAGVPCGILSARDLGAPRSPAADERSVADLMTPRVLTIDRDATVAQAANRMRGRSVGSLVVTHRHRIVGIVTVADLLTLIGQGIERQPKRRARPALRTRVPHRKARRTGAAW
jgi:CBS domain-containing protein